MVLKMVNMVFFCKVNIWKAHVWGVGGERERERKVAFDGKGACGRIAWKELYSAKCWKAMGVRNGKALLVED